MAHRPCASIALDVGRELLARRGNSDGVDALIALSALPGDQLLDERPR